MRDVVEVQATHSENEAYTGVDGEKDLAGLIAQSRHHLEKSPLEKRLLRKADMVILPIAALAYFASYLVRKKTLICGFEVYSAYETVCANRRRIVTVLETRRSWVSPLIYQ